MAVPIVEDSRNPGTDGVCGDREQQEYLNKRRAGNAEDRQRDQNAGRDRDDADLPWLAIRNRAGPGKFRLVGIVEQAPIGADAAFEGFPRLVEGFDQIVVDAESLRRGRGRSGSRSPARACPDRPPCGYSPRSASRTPQSRRACRGKRCAAA